jgi:DNA-binding CsgD family transcriptional regulator/PAS domain-containing protein
MTHANDAAMHEAIGLVYDSALDPAIWPSALQAMCGLVDACQGSISVLNPKRREIRLSTEWAADPEWPKWRKLLHEKYAAMMPLYGYLVQSEIGSVNNTAQMAAHIGHPAIYEEPFFKEWALPAGYRDVISSLVMRTPDRYGVLSLQTSTRRDLVGPHELAIGRLLVPHVRRAVSIADLLDMATAKAATLQATLDSLNTAVVVTDASARILHANSAAETMLRSGAPIGTQDGILHSRQAAAEKALLTAIGQTVGAAGNIGAHGISVPLRSSDGSPAIAHVLPLARGGQHRDWGPRAAAAVFISPTEFAPPEADALIALYGLTSMEVRVLLLVASGKKRAEAAVCLGIADSTVKTHLDHIFSKTGVGDQARLSHLVRDLSSPGRKAD